MGRELTAPIRTPAAFCLFLTVALRAGAAVPLIALEEVGQLAPGGAFALSMPSAAVRLPGDQWAILDGVNDRIVITDGEGNGLRALGQDVLNAPLGLTRSSEGLFWVADSANGRVVALSVSGDIEAEHTLPRTGRQPPEPVDLAWVQEGRVLAVVDNNNHCIHQLDVLSGEWGATWGSAGTQLDQLNHPFSVAIGPTGLMAIVDVINSRVLCREPEYDFNFQIGEWGVDAGALYRPKGVAFDRFGRVWVTDSVYGVVQVFTDSGDLIAVAAEAGEVRHFRTPTRLAFDERGRLAVVEMLANRVTLWSIAE